MLTKLQDLAAELRELLRTTQYERQAQCQLNEYLTALDVVKGNAEVLPPHVRDYLMLKAVADYLSTLLELYVVAQTLK